MARGMFTPGGTRRARLSGTWGSYWVHTSEGPKRRYVSGKNKGETRKALAKARGDRDAGLFFDAGNLTLEQYLARWLEDSVKGSVGDRTYHSYRDQARNHIIPTLGRLKLQAISPAHVQGLYSSNPVSRWPRCATSTPSCTGR